MADDLERRLDAVERAITDSERSVADLSDAAELTDRVDRVEERSDDVEERLADLEAAVRALRGCVGHLRASADGPEPRSDVTGARSGEHGGSADGAAQGEAGRTDGGSQCDAGGAVSDAWTWAGESDDGPDRGGEDGVTRGARDEPTATDYGRRPNDSEPTSGRATSDGGEADDTNAATQRSRGEMTRDSRTTGASPGRDDGRASTDRRRRTAPGSPPTGDRRVGEPERDGRQRAAAGWSSATAEAGDGDRVHWRDEPQSGRREGERGGRHERREDWRESDDRRWPGGDRAEPVDDRRPESDDGSWPAGLDIERAEPWSVPEPPTVRVEKESDEDGGLVERLREAL
jgi:hypothetical protein